MGRGASLINQMIILNNAGIKLEEHIAAQASKLTEKQQFNLVQSMEDEASDVYKKSDLNRPLYKTIFPEKEMAI
jgi:type II secretory pathway component PulF